MLTDSKEETKKKNGMTDEERKESVGLFAVFVFA
ncbi:hypothetical protein PIIN_11354 [Serendipita indica DSM 11827]|uniref:Uncharacterized protein n=1 Tax=Serendipita indica (strain DSM 11827) TaxID=1109443 RepID=G4U1D4_SERID|nr:hypothetical protein PIIN_11354 [Serendipita indica DSM 11827]